MIVDPLLSSYFSFMFYFLSHAKTSLPFLFHAKRSSPPKGAKGNHANLAKITHRFTRVCRRFRRVYSRQMASTSECSCSLRDLRALSNCSAVYSVKLRNICPKSKFSVQKNLRNRGYLMKYPRMRNEISMNT